MWRRRLTSVTRLDGVLSWQRLKGDSLTAFELEGKGSSGTECAVRSSEGECV
ncbi:uncharacterized protein G2W53_002561 [Senna tora]|uniref:Uncharacterized protein n=1 Tax=Senna tora TaxID=362788 RepID=A0A834X7H1_9FABA|nr:uncharacterized protein G2W53_002561 [Senna tora]